MNEEIMNNNEVKVIDEDNLAPVVLAYEPKENNAMGWVALGIAAAIGGGIAVGVKALVGKIKKAKDAKKKEEPKEQEVTEIIDAEPEKVKVEVKKK